MDIEFIPKGWHSRGYLPHFDGGQIAQSINLHLFDSLPQNVLNRWRKELEKEESETARLLLHKRIEKYLDHGYGSCFLRDPRIAALVQESLLHNDGKRYQLWAWVVMPNHAHFLITPHADEELSEIMKSLKTYTSRMANRILRRRGQFWMEDYFDRYIRDERHFANAVTYIENNPVKARLCARPEDWAFGSNRWRKANTYTGTADVHVRSS